MLNDLIHSAQLLIQTPTVHGAVLSSRKVGEERRKDPAGIGGGSHRQAALHTHLRDADAAKKGRFPALIGTGDDEQAFLLNVTGISHRIDPLLDTHYKLLQIRKPQRILSADSGKTVIQSQSFHMVDQVYRPHIESHLQVKLIKEIVIKLQKRLAEGHHISDHLKLQCAGLLSDRRIC